MSIPFTSVIGIKMIYCHGIPGLISPRASVYYMAAAIGNEWCQNQTDPVLLSVGAICSADDRQWLPVYADFSPFMCFYVFAAVFGMEASGNILFAPAVVGFFSKCSERLTCARTSVMSELNGEMPAGIHASFRNWSRRHHSVESKSFSTSSWYGCVLAEIAAHSTAPSKHIRSREEQV